MSTTLQVSEHTQQICSGLSTYRRGSLFCDLTVWCQGVQYEVHRAVLAASSPYFEKLILAKGTSADRIHLDHLHPEGVTQVLEFIYNGRVVVTSDNVQLVMQSANILEMNVLYRKCSSLMKSQLTSETFASTWDIADVLRDENLMAAVVDFCVGNYQRLRNQRNFLSLSQDRLQKIITDDRLSASPDQLLETVVEWLRLKNVVHEELKQLCSIIRSETASKNFFQRLSNERTILEEFPLLRRFVYAVLEIRHGRKPEEEEQEEEESTSTFLFNSTEESSPCILAFLETHDNQTMMLSYVLNDNHATKSQLWFHRSPFDVRHSGTLMLANHLYCVGGKNPEQEPMGFTSSFYEYNVLDYQVRTLSPLKTPRAQMGLVVHRGNLLYAIGGFNSTGELSEVECYSFSKDTWSVVSAMNVARKGLACISFGDKIYAVGGYRKRETLTTVECYDSDVDQWTEVCPLVFPRTHCSLAALDDKLYAVGGYWSFGEFARSSSSSSSSSALLGNVQCYDPVGDCWSVEEERLPTSDMDLITVVFPWKDRKLYFVSANGRVFVYSPTEYFKKLYQIPHCKGFVRCAFLVPNTNLLSMRFQSADLQSFSQ